MREPRSLAYSQSPAPAQHPRRAKPRKRRISTTYKPGIKFREVKSNGGIIGHGWKPRDRRGRRRHGRRLARAMIEIGAQLAQQAATSRTRGRAVGGQKRTRQAGARKMYLRIPAWRACRVAFLPCGRQQAAYARVPLARQQKKQVIMAKIADKRRARRRPSAPDMAAAEEMAWRPCANDGSPRARHGGAWASSVPLAVDGNEIMI